jgi:hypothetical protein
MRARLVKTALGLFLVPFCIGFTWQFGAGVFGIAYKPELPYYFLAGAIAYLTVHFLFRKPILTYVFGHELTHALFAVLFGGAVKSFQASDKGGQVTVTKSNFVITLAPYFFPLYTFITLILYWVLSAANATGGVRALVFLAGSTFAFHLTLTVIFLRTDQKDIREHGALFSYPLIYLFNLLFGAFLLHLLLAQKNGFLDFVGNGIIRSVRVCVAAFTGLRGMFQS